MGDCERGGEQFGPPSNLSPPNDGDGVRDTPREVSASSWSSLPWRSISDAPASSVKDGDSEGDDGGYNHYDDPSSADPSELYKPGYDEHGGRIGNRADGADDPGILLGLEVVDGSLYDLIRQEGKSGSVTRAVAKGDETTIQEHADSNSDGKTSENSRSKKRGRNEVGNENGGRDINGEDSPDERRTEPRAKEKVDPAVKERRKQKKKLKAKQRKLRREGKEVVPANIVKAPPPPEGPTSEQIESIRRSWLAPTGAYLHRNLCASLAKRGFDRPTPVQAATLGASILGRRDIVGAAPTGSGKTLAYGLPLLQGILERHRPEEGEVETVTAVTGRVNKVEGVPLEALILCPTRELALQVSDELSIASHGTVAVATIVGGLAEVKQARVLSRKPPVVVGTPGRLWGLVSYEFLLMCTLLVLIEVCLCCDISDIC